MSKIDIEKMVDDFWTLFLKDYQDEEEENRYKFVTYRILDELSYYFQNNILTGIAACEKLIELNDKVDYPEKESMINWLKNAINN